MNGPVRKTDSAGWKSWQFIAILSFVFSLGIFAGYLLSQSKVNELSKQVTTLKNQVAALNAEKTDQRQKVDTYTSIGGDSVQIDAPRLGSKVSSPLVVVGKLPGSWFFEASFPVTLKDANGKVLARIPAQAHGKWMTDDNVAFSAVLEFDETPTTPTGTLVLEKDNPSGLAENADSVTIPINFE